MNKMSFRIDIVLWEHCSLFAKWTVPTFHFSCKRQKKLGIYGMWEFMKSAGEMTTVVKLPLIYSRSKMLVVVIIHLHMTWDAPPMVNHHWWYSRDCVYKTFVTKDNIHLSLKANSVTRKFKTMLRDAQKHGIGCIYKVRDTQDLVTRSLSHLHYPHPSS